MSHRQSRVNVLHIVIALKYFRLVCNVKSVLVEMMNVVMVRVDNFRKYTLITVYFKLFDRKDARIVVSESER